MPDLLLHGGDGTGQRDKRLFLSVSGALRSFPLHASRLPQQRSRPHGRPQGQSAPDGGRWSMPRGITPGTAKTRCLGTFVGERVLESPSDSTLRWRSPSPVSGAAARWPCAAPRSVSPPHWWRVACRSPGASRHPQEHPHDHICGSTKRSSYRHRVRAGSWQSRTITTRVVPPDRVPLRPRRWRRWPS